MLISTCTLPQFYSYYLLFKSISSMLVLWRRGWSRSTLYHLNNLCPPGVWTCLTGKRSLSGKLLLRTQDSVTRRSCPPEGWTCSTGKRSHIPNRQFTSIAVTVQDNNEDNSSKDPAYRSRHILTSRKKMFKRMLKKRTPTMKGFQASKVVCPPGVWTCSTGKGWEA